VGGLLILVGVVINNKNKKEVQAEMQAEIMPLEGGKQMRCSISSKHTCGAHIGLVLARGQHWLLDYPMTI